MNKYKNSPFQSFDSDQAVVDAVVEHRVEEPVIEALTSIEVTAFFVLRIYISQNKPPIVRISFYRVSRLLAFFFIILYLYIYKRKIIHLLYQREILGFNRSC